MNGAKNMSVVLEKERAFLDRVSRSYVTSESSQDRLIRSLVVRTFAPFLHGRVLELGCSDGYMTELLSAHAHTVDVVDGCERFLDTARKRNLPNARFIQSMFEEFKTDRQYDCVVAAFILEHVADVQATMAMIRAALKSNGLLLAAVPNARALSRQLARQMGLIRDLTDLTPNDHNHGHRRVYDRVSWNRDLESAGFKPIAQGGGLLKPLADFQLEKLIDSGILGPEQIEGLYGLGADFPDLCGSLWAVCRIQPGNLSC
jgi:SAM-dependent methyltransferase